MEELFDECTEVFGAIGFETEADDRLGDGDACEAPADVVLDADAVDFEDW